MKQIKTVIDVEQFLIDLHFFSNCQLLDEKIIVMLLT